MVMSAPQLPGVRFSDAQNTPITWLKDVRAAGWDKHQLNLPAFGSYPSDWSAMSSKCIQQCDKRSRWESIFSEEPEIIAHDIARRPATF
jgi:hypothetical protein